MGAGLLMAAVAGCGQKADEGPKPQISAETVVEDQIRAIQNNPNMPEPAKQQAIARIRSQQQQGAAQAQGQAQGQQAGSR